MITLNDAKLLNYFKEVDQLPDAEQHVILKVITAYLRDFRVHGCKIHTVLKRKKY